MANIHTPTKRVLVKSTIDPLALATSSATTTGTGVDCLNATVAMAVAHCKISAGTSVTYTFEDSPDNITYTPDVFSANEFPVVVPSGATGTQVNSPALLLMSINLKKRQRYLRAKSVKAGGVTGAEMVQIHLYNEGYQAVTQDITDVVN